ncbi:hypothetical protein HMPREF1212_03496 [Parabacteroides sp. HGS0025]|nr:hypothetical protein HMPREF1212_03496 [Parabacteroides sp. HGS0025]
MKIQLLFRCSTKNVDIKIVLKATIQIIIVIYVLLKIGVIVLG